MRNRSRSLNFCSGQAMLCLEFPSIFTHRDSDHAYNGQRNRNALLRQTGSIESHRNVSELFRQFSEAGVIQYPALVRHRFYPRHSVEAGSNPRLLPKVQ